MSRSETDFLVVGHVARPHGTGGELLVRSLTDNPGDVFAPGVVLRPSDDDGAQPDPALSPLRVAAARPYRQGWLVTFGGVGERSAAESLRGRYVLIERARLPPLAEGEVFVHDLIGLEVLAGDGERVGEVTEVFELEPADLLEVRTTHGDILIPFAGHIVREVDLEGSRLVVELPEGLLE